VPQPGDDVVINQPGNVQVTLSSSTSIHSLSVTGDTLAVTGGTLSVAGDSSNSGSISISPGAQLKLAGNYTQPSGGALTLPAAGLSTGVGTNLLSNAGFASPSAGGSSTTPPRIWISWGTSYLSTQYAHSGTQSLQEYGPNSGVLESFTATPGVSYTGTAYAMTPSTNPLTGPEGGFLEVIFYDANGTQISPNAAPNSINILNSGSSTGGPIPGSVGNQGWNYFTTTAVAPSNAASVDFFLESGAYTGRAGTAGGAVFWDDVAFGPTAANSARLNAVNISNSGAMNVGAGDVVTASGTFTQTGTGALDVQLGGPAASGLYGVVSATGSATLAGKLQADLVNGYSPSVNDGFNVVTYAGETGTFAAYQLPSGSTYMFQSVVSPTYVGVGAVLPQLTATINTGTAIEPVPANMLGVNLAWWDDKLTTSQTQQMVEAAGMNSFRFPGGSSSDDYHFNVAHNYNVSTAQGIPQFAEFIQAVGGTGLITLDYGSGSPQEAAAELAYLEGSPSDTTVIGTGIEWNDSTNQWQNINWQTVGYWASLRAAAPLGTDDGLNFLRINHPAAFTSTYFWEVGNEEYGNWEIDHHGTSGPGGASTGVQRDPTTYAAFAHTFATFAAEIDPNISIGIDSGDPTTGYNSWTKNVLAAGEAIGFVPGFISDHSYMQGPGSESDSTLLLHTVADPTAIFDWSTRYADYQTMLQATVGSQASSVSIMATEFNSVYTNPGKQSTSLVNGLFIADSLGSLLTSGYTGGYVWDLRNGWSTGNNNSSSLYGWRQGGDYGMLGDPNTSAPPSTGPYVPYPNYFAEQLASKIIQLGGTIVSASSNYQGLPVYAVKEANGHVDLLVINKDGDANLTEQFTVQGFEPNGQAQVWQYGEAQDYAQSHTSDGSAALANYTATLSVNGNSFSYTFPAYSMTVLDLTPVVLSLGISGPSDGFHGVSGQTRTYTFSATPSVPVSGETFSYTINWGDGQTTIAGPGSASPISANHVYTAAGSYTITLTATDQFGATGTSATATATILSAEMQGTTLAIGGTTGNDKIVLSAGSNGQWSATLNGQALGTFTPSAGMIYGDGGRDTVTINGTPAADSFTLDPTDVIVNSLMITGNGIATWQLNGMGGSNTYTVHPGAAAQINGGTGPNTLIGPNTPNTWRIIGASRGIINGLVYFGSIQDLTGGTNTDTFTILPGASILGTVAGGGGIGDRLNYTSYGAAVSVNLQTQTATGVASFANIQAVVGAGVNDTLVGPDAGATWYIKDQNAGTVGKFSFNNVENLVGGAGSDTFVFTDGKGVTGSINGGGALNSLNYSQYTSAVTVNLAIGAATGVGGTISNIQMVLGGSGSNTLTGGAGGDILVGGAGTNQITGGSGSSLLIGGAGADTVNGNSSGGDLIIGGSTSYDNNLGALIAIFREWQRTDITYAQRIAHLRGTQSGGLNRNFDLTGSTVQFSSVADELTGGPGMDWFWANQSLDTINNLQPGEQVN
jgi:hypothetical protein